MLGYYTANLLRNYYGFFISENLIFYLKNLRQNISELKKKSDGKTKFSIVVCSNNRKIIAMGISLIVRKKRGILKTVGAYNSQWRLLSGFLEGEPFAGLIYGVKTFKVNPGLK